MVAETWAHIVSARDLVFGLAGFSLALAGNALSNRIATNAASTQLLALAGVLDGIAGYFQKDQVSHRHLEILRDILGSLSATSRDAISPEFERLLALSRSSEKAHVVNGRLVFGFNGGSPETGKWLSEAKRVTERIQDNVAMMKGRGSLKET